MASEAARPFLPGAFQVKFATEAWERAEAARLRRDVFCSEQKLFEGDDRDDVDRIAVPIVALATVAGIPYAVVGTVRIHESSPGVWFGSRLAVDRDHRRVGTLGSALIRVAVSSAHARGCRRFLAHVQSQNASLFHTLHWTTIEEIDLHGRPHHFMQADLAHYPPLDDARTGILALAKLTAAP